MHDFSMVYTRGGISDDDLIGLENEPPKLIQKSGEPPPIVIGAGVCINNHPSHGPSILAHNEADGRLHLQHDVHFPRIHVLGVGIPRTLKWLTVENFSPYFKVERRSLRPLGAGAGFKLQHRQNLPASSGTKNIQLTDEL
jgi:hypothetical protein